MNYEYINKLSETLTEEDFYLALDFLANEKNRFGEPCFLVVRIDPESGRNIYRPNLGIKELLRLLAKYESKKEFKLVLEAMMEYVIDINKRNLDTSIAS